MDSEDSFYARGCVSIVCLLLSGGLIVNGLVGLSTGYEPTRYGSVPGSGWFPLLLGLVMAVFILYHWILDYRRR